MHADPPSKADSSRADSSRAEPSRADSSRDSGASRTPDLLPGAATRQSLARGLHVLRRLVESSKPMTGSELAREMGLHQSSLSRVLATLTEAGFVRKDMSGRFVPDYGLIALAAQTTRLPLLTKPQEVLTEFLRDHHGLTVTTAMLWRSEIIYLVRAHLGGNVHVYELTGTQLNVSAPGLLLLLDLPHDEAVALLAESRRLRGWRGDPGIVPVDEESVLAAARERFDGETLLLRGWAGTGLSGAIAVETSEPHPVALAIVDPRTEPMEPDEMRVLLHQVRRELERSFRG